MRRFFNIAALSLALCGAMSGCLQAPESTSQERGEGKPAPAPLREKSEPKADAVAVRVPLLGAKIKGSDEALVTIVEFSDYACPFCKKAHETVESLLGQYGKRVRLAVFEKPLPFHKVAAPAAKWAYAAGEQGKYWQARDMLFEHQKALGDEGLAALARELGLDAERLERDRNSAAAEKAVQAGLDLSDSLGVEGTPTFFINGRRVVGAQPAEKIREVIDAAEAEAAKLVARGVARRDVYAEILKTAAAPGSKAAKTAGNAGHDPDCKGGGGDCKGGCDEPGGEAAGAEDAVLAVDIGDSPARGPANAAVTIVVFTDFECPFCRKAEETVRTLESEYKGKLRVVYKGYPLPFHQSSRPATKAALAAHRQGKFFEYRDALFEHQDALDRGALLKYAAALGLDVRRFERDMDDKAIEAQLAADEAQVSKLDVKGTPTFFVNGRRLRGAQPVAAFRTAIARALEGR